MNLGNVNLIIGIISALIGILVYLYKGVRHNSARNKAQQGRIEALLQIATFQGKRLTVVERYIAKEDAGNYQINYELIELEEQALADFRKHDTKLTENG